MEGARGVFPGSRPIPQMKVATGLSPFAGGGRGAELAGSRFGILVKDERDLTEILAYIFVYRKRICSSLRIDWLMRST